MEIRIRNIGCFVEASSSYESEPNELIREAWLNEKSTKLKCTRVGPTPTIKA